jgi:hypothetical protein
MRFFAFGDTRTMNILIVGNGFDLSHYLPTKYDHFMDVMGAIEKKNLGKPIQNVFSNPVNTLPELILKVLEIKRAVDEKTYQMNFDDLFAICRDKKFVSKTKEIYDTTSIILSIERIVELQYKLKNNCWYQYFKNHVEEIKTWIDFEQKIEEVLIVLARCIVEISSFHDESKVKRYLNNVNQDNLNVRKKDLVVLNFFNFTVVNQAAIQQPISLNKIFCHGEKIENGFNPSYFVTSIHQHLEEFIEIFNLYIELVINQLIPAHKFSIESNEWISPDQIFSFNYTNTYQKFYDQLTETDYLHGRFGEKQNIVLGVSDLHNESLKKLKAYGFTKYHQKLLKDTDYQFLSENWHAINLKSFWQSVKNGKAITLEDKEIHQMNIYIWGHSLDTSDETYINEIFSFNTEVDEQVRVIVYYFDTQANFDLLANLIHILKKDKVELWMKKGWLKFEPNPDIAKLNNIEPVELPKLAEA